MKSKINKICKIQDLLIWSMFPSGTFLSGITLWYVANFADIIVLIGLLLTVFSFLTSMIAIYNKKWMKFISRLIPAVILCVYVTNSYFENFFPKTGINIKITLRPNYINQCKMSKYFFNNKLEQIGVCSIVNHLLSSDSDYILYDSSGEIGISHENRSGLWKDSAKKLQNGDIISNYAIPVKKVSENFYVITISVQDVDKTSVY